MARINKLLQLLHTVISYYPGYNILNTGGNWKILCEETHPGIIIFVEQNLLDWI